MSADRSYQSLPASSDLIERAARDHELGSVLYLLPRLFRDRFAKGPRPWPEVDKLCLELRQLVADNPGLENRNCFLDARWDALYYLLSANGRGEAGDRQDLALEHAVRGASDIADHVFGAQGAPVRYIAPREVSQIASLLRDISPVMLRTRFDPQRMAAEGVYKFSPDRADDVWADVAKRFDDFRRFYRMAAEHGETVIVVLD